MSNQIKNILFDFGGVLYLIKYEATFEKLSEVLGINVTLGNWPPWFKTLVYEYEVGKVSSESFINRLQREANTNQVPTAQSIISAWNTMLIDWSYGIHDMLEKLSVDYKILILSNTNHLHFNHIKRQAENNGLWTSLVQKIDRFYLSHEIGYRKPSFECFKLIIEEQNILEEETLFVDDYQYNFKELSQSRIKFAWHDPSLSISSVIKNYLDIVC